MVYISNQSEGKSSFDEGCPVRQPHEKFDFLELRLEV